MTKPPYASSETTDIERKIIQLKTKRRQLIESIKKIKQAMKR
jgi:hypothetical protein